MIKRTEMSDTAYKVFRFAGSTKAKIMRKNKMTAEEFVLFVQEYECFINYNGQDIYEDSFILLLNDDGEIARINYKSKVKPLLYSKIAIWISIFSVFAATSVSLLLHFLG